MIEATDAYVPTGDWTAIDAAISRLGRSKAEHDYEEGRWLLAARRAAVHTRLGFASLGEYIERRLGHDPRTTAEKLRVASALADLPLLKESLRAGVRPWTAVREIVRVAVSTTEAEWLRATERKSVREIEHMVAGLHPGDGPAQPKDPALRKHVVRLELSPELFARFRDATDRIRKEVDPTLTEEQAVGAMVDRILGGPDDEGRSAYQVSVTVCAACERTWQQSRGELLEVEAEVGERALCDGQIIGPAPAPDAGEAPTTHVGPEPGPTTTPVGREVPASAHWSAHLESLGRASQTVTPRSKRLVITRDKGRCSVNGCSNSRYLNIHHLVPRAQGGGHDPSGLILLCSTHHRLLHAGLLLVEGTPSTGLRFFHADGSAYGAAPPTLVTVDAAREAHLALRSLGMEEARARSLLAEARRELVSAASAPELVRAALRISGRGMALKRAPEGAVFDRPARPHGAYARALAGGATAGIVTRDGARSAA